MSISFSPCLQLRLGEKRILRGTMDGVRRRLAPIRGIPTKVIDLMQRLHLLATVQLFSSVHVSHLLSSGNLR